MAVYINIKPSENKSLSQENKAKRRRNVLIEHFGGSFMYIFLLFKMITS